MSREGEEEGGRDLTGGGGGGGELGGPGYEWRRRKVEIERRRGLVRSLVNL